MLAQNMRKKGVFRCPPFEFMSGTSDEKGRSRKGQACRPASTLEPRGVIARWTYVCARAAEGQEFYTFCTQNSSRLKLRVLQLQGSTALLSNVDARSFMTKGGRATV